MSITFFGGSEIHFSGVDDPEKLKSIEGITSIWIEEATEFTKHDYNQINVRLRGKRLSYKQIILTFNPTGKGWIYDRFFSRGGLEPTGRERKIKNRILTKLNITTLRTTWRDNHFLDDEYTQELEAYGDPLSQSYDENFNRVYNLGEWGELKNIIYSKWFIKDISQNPQDYNYLSDGLDFGFVHPSAFLRMGYIEGDIYIFQEFYQSGLTNTELMAKLELIDFNSGEVILADGARPEYIEEFEREGFIIEAADKGPGSVKFGIDWLKRRRIYIHPTCLNTIREIQGYKFKELKSGVVLEEPLKARDDAMDAMRYGSLSFHDLEVKTNMKDGWTPAPKRARGY